MPTERTVHDGHVEDIDRIAATWSSHNDCRVIASQFHRATVTTQKVVYDLGCGDGRICIEAAESRGAKACGEHHFMAPYTQAVQVMSFFVCDRRLSTTLVWRRQNAVQSKCQCTTLRRWSPSLLPTLARLSQPLGVLGTLQGCSFATRQTPKSTRATKEFSNPLPSGWICCSFISSLHSSIHLATLALPAVGWRRELCDSSYFPSMECRSISLSWIVQLWILL